MHAAWLELWHPLSRQAEESCTMGCDGKSFVGTWHGILKLIKEENKLLLY